MRRLTILGVILSVGLMALLIVALPASASDVPGGPPYDEIVDNGGPFKGPCPTGFDSAVPRNAAEAAIDRAGNGDRKICLRHTPVAPSTGDGDNGDNDGDNGDNDGDNGDDDGDNDDDDGDNGDDDGDNDD